MLVDSHCHLDRLDLSKYDHSLEKALDVARKKGVGGFLCIGIGFDNAENLMQLENQHEDVWLSMGVHPLNKDLSVDEERLRFWCSKPQVQAVGETGLDYHYQPETRTQQIASFESHLRIASELDKPVIVHTRNAQEDTLHLIREQRVEAGGVLHCFTESWEMAEQALDLGYYISLSGIVTFRNADTLREVAKKVPQDRLLIETDSPYLAPVPKRGKPNDPSLLPYVAGCIAELRGVSIETLGEQTTDNFHRLFPNTQRSCSDFIKPNEKGGQMLDESRPELKDQEAILNQFNAMLELQDKMNTRVHENWKEQSFAWYRAIWTECAETLDHFGWKWWKKQSPDRDQVCMELVDIWHFGLSILLLEGAKLTELLGDLSEPEVDPEDFRELLEDFTAATLTTKSFDLQKFRRLMSAVDMSMDDLYCQYIGKNVLNFFRQDHGYKEGTYHKTWNDREDNEHLVDVLATLDPNHEAFADALYAELESRYPTD